jgi:hypothetical protein
VLGECIVLDAIWDKIIRRNTIPTNSFTVNDIVDRYLSAVYMAEKPDTKQTLAEVLGHFTVEQQQQAIRDQEEDLARRGVNTQETPEERAARLREETEEEYLPRRKSKESREAAEQAARAEADSKARDEKERRRQADLECHRKVFAAGQEAYDAAIAAGCSERQAIRRKKDTAARVATELTGIEVKPFSYNSASWRRRRKRVIKENEERNEGRCEECKRGFYRSDHRIVDHTQSIASGGRIFDRNNLRVLCRLVDTSRLGSISHVPGRQNRWQQRG